MSRLGMTARSHPRSGSPIRRADPLRDLTALATLAMVAVSLALAGCVPNLGPAPQPKPLGVYQTSRTLSAPATDWPADDWWKAYGDPQLDALIAEALAGSPDLAA